ncbi:UPF0594 protein C13orf38 homolog [Clonorchis sinensis]|uniref:UPF0594 protein C13orf38 homolog n=1 Tax=Clonorchis sinensis TaxID=79923 RepID=H2KRZ7_CLOSI|nr:UPF0594 protein C13orf38 homolog [Clonorchis sinensis]
MTTETVDELDTVKHGDPTTQEKAWLTILRETNEKLAKSIEMVEEQLQSIHDESNEWKTRYEIQKEINDYFRKSFIICDQHIPKAKNILQIVKSTARRGSTIVNQVELDEEPIEVLEEYKQYIQRLCKELECRIEQEGKAYYWATDIRKQALIELNYTYVPAPSSKFQLEKLNENILKPERPSNGNVRLYSVATRNKETKADQNILRCSSSKRNLHLREESGSMIRVFKALLASSPKKHRI